MFDIYELVLSIVVPVDNEEEVLPEFCSCLFPVLESLQEPREVIFVNDGSTNRSFEILHRFCEKNSSLKVVDFFRNFGHQAALSAGLNRTTLKGKWLCRCSPPKSIEFMIPTLSVSCGVI